MMAENKKPEPWLITAFVKTFRQQVNELTQRLDTLNKRIWIMQEMCGDEYGHDFEEVSHDSHTVLKRCKICGKEVIE